MLSRSHRHDEAAKTASVGAIVAMDILHISGEARIMEREPTSRL
jgi:hypothetical protein